MKFDSELASFASIRQLEYLEAVEKHGSNNKAAKALGVTRRVVDRGIERLKQAAALRGWAPKHDMNKIVPDGFLVKGVSTYYDKDGNKSAQWVKSSASAERRDEMFRSFIEELCQDIKGKAPTVKPPAATVANLLACYPIGDHHFGMHATKEDVGADYNCEIASHALESAINHLSELAPPAETALLINLGDALHTDDSSNQTKGHGHLLDVDGRFPRIMQSAAMSLIRGVLRLLEKHQKVIVWNMRGNHDPDASMSLAMAMSFYFHNEPRVEVDMGSSLYKYLRYGSNLIGSHHGHGAKGGDLPLIMATDRKEDWGQTDHRVWHCGHIHHKTQKEFPGCVVETHRTLAGSDAWHAGKGYRSKKDMNSIIYHREFGEIQRTRFDMGMV